MPELPEVETIVKSLSREITGRRITEVAVLTPFVIAGDPEALRQALIGKEIVSVRRHGKSIFMDLNLQNGRSGNDSHSPEPTFLHIHLRMTGQLLFLDPAAPADKHTHLRIRIDGLSRELRYRDIRKFGRFTLIDSVKAVPAIPDAWLSPRDQILAALRRRSGMLKHALLNQNVIAGLGNIYVDESLHAAKLHPTRTLGSLRPSQLDLLCDCIGTVLKSSIELGGTSFRNYVDTRGERGGFKGRLSVYGKAGRPCACGGTIRRTVVAGRGTFFCPRCQRAPRSKA